MTSAKIIFLLIIIGWFFFTFRITQVPPGINGDEATLGYNAALLSKTLHDENNKFLPLFVSTHEGSDWKQPVSIYFTTLTFSIFGPSYFALRSVSVFFILLSTMLIFILLKEMFQLRFAVFGTLIFMTIPAVTIQSHLALENIVPIPFVIFWVFTLLKYKKNKKVKYLLFSGISLGLSLYSYQAMRVIAPVFMSLTIFYLMLLNGNFLKKKWIKPVIIFMLGVLPFILFFLIVRKEYPGALGAHNRPVFPQSYQELILSYISSYDLTFLFVQGDSTLYHSTGKQGVFLLASLPLFLAGIYQCIKKRGSILILILAAFFTAPILFGLVPQALHRGSRLLAFLPLFTIIATFGLKGFLTISKTKLRMGILSIVTILMVFNFLDFANDYWFKYPDRVRAVFPSNEHIIFDIFYKKSVDLNKRPLIQKDLYENMKYDRKFFDKVYFPQGLKTWSGDEIELGSIILISENMLPLAEKLGAKKLESNLSDFILVIKNE